MRRLYFLPMLALLACGGGDKTEEGETKTEGAAAEGAAGSDEDKAFYALGLSIGRSLEQFQLTEAELGHVKEGLSDAVGGKEPKVKLEEYIGKVKEIAQKRAQSAAASQKEKSGKFLEDLAKSPGATRLPSGLVYIETQAGTGAQPKDTDTVSVQYKGTLIDGKEFDSSYSRGEPAKFPLRGVVPCWTEGLQKMKVGGKAKLGCPSDLAYGDDGRPPAIPGGAALVFEVELVSIEGK